MKNRIFIIIGVMLAAVAFIFLTTAASFSTSQVNTDYSTVEVVTCTNKVPDNVTETANVGQAIDMGGYRYLCIEQEFALHAAGTEVCTFNWVTSGAGTNYATTAQHAFAQAANGTTKVRTNIVLDMAGKRKAKILSIVCGNTTTADMTNILVTVTKRRLPLDQ